MPLLTSKFFTFLHFQGGIIITLIFGILLLHHQLVKITAAATASTDPCFFGWGRKDASQLDPSIHDNIRLPTPFGHGILHQKNISHISAGFTHSVILDTDGNAYCFGSNSRGECGQGMMQTRSSIRHPKKMVSDETFNQKRIIHTSLGIYKSYMMDDNGQVYFVGVNDLVEVSPKTYNLPMGVTFPHPVSSVSVGGDFILLLSKDGEIHGFGSGNANGQLGIGNKEPQSYPVAVNTSGVLHGKTITQISAGFHHSLCLSSEGRVFAWGSNGFGELGISEGSKTKLLPVAVDMSGALYGKFIKQISAGYHYSLVLSSSGEVFGFGRNEHGQIGAGTTAQYRHSPVAVDTSGVLSGKTIVQISASFTHSLVLSSDGKVFGFGAGDLGQLGIGSTSSPQYAPVAVDTSGALAGKFIKQIATGGSHSLVLSSEGEVFSFGENSDGQAGFLGNDSREGFVEKFVEFPVAVAKGYNFQHFNISSISSYNHILFSDNHGNLLASGENEHGELGDGSVVFPRATDSIPIRFKVFQISAGYRYSLILSSEGQVYAAGLNEMGQLGIGGKTDPQPTLTEVDPMSEILREKTIVQISAKYSHSLVLSADGRVFSWGNNRQGQLGTGTFSLAEYSPVAVDMSGVLSGKIIVQVSAGFSHSLVLSADGKVFAWGNNGEGQLGSGSVSLVESSPVAVDTSGALARKFIHQISVGGDYSMLLSSDGKMFGFGAGDFGQLATGDAPAAHRVPVAVNTSGVLHGKTITQISAGYHHVLCLSSDGEIFGWGLNTAGQLGTGTLNSIMEILPVAVNLSRVGSGYSRQSAKVFAGTEDSFLSFCHTTTCFGMSHLHPLVCSNRGECISDDLCSCQEGYAPPSCQYPICNGKPSTDASVCSGNGNCTSPDHCECANGHAGRECENFLCFGVLNTNPSACQGNGRCIDPNLCSCDTDYEGKICDIWKNCFSIASSDSSRVCSGRGKCIRTDICECSWQWSGRECESLSTAIWLIIMGAGISALLVTCFFGGTCSSIVVAGFALCRRVKRVEKEKKLTEHLLQGFVRDTEMDTVDADSQRARLIVQKSMLEIDFSELSELQKIGSGGSGAILFRAKWNDSVVAVKVFKSGLMSGDTFFDEFEHEVSLMSTLRHRNVISFYGCSLAYPRIAIVMELCEAGSVETLIENGVLQNKSSHEVLQMLLDIAEGMSFLHSRQVIHRDLKCANVLVDEHGVCKLTDFGLSKYTKDQVEKAHTVGIGTSYYIAPELANGSGEYDSSVDVYAFGIMAMEMFLCRMCPFPGASCRGNASQVQRKALQDSSYRPDVAELAQEYSSLQWVLQLCWHEDPKLRPPFRDIARILRSSLFDVGARVK